MRLALEYLKMSSNDNAAVHISRGQFFGSRGYEKVHHCLRGITSLLEIQFSLEFFLLNRKMN